MFPIHETTRRRICRGSFVLLCALPTLATLAFGLSRQLPSHQRAAEAVLSAALGLDAHFEGLSHPRPERLRVRGLELRNPETGAWVLRTLRADVEQHSSGPALILGAVEINAAEVDCLERALDRQLRREAAADWKSGRLSAESVALVSGKTTQAFLPVQATLKPGSAETEGAELELLMGYQVAEASNVLTVRVKRRQAADVTRVEVTTGASPVGLAPLPCLAPLQAWLGSGARFQGDCWIETSATTTRGGLHGRFDEVDLHQLVAAHFPHALTGTAVLQLNAAEWEAGRLTQAWGELRSLVGSSSNGLVGRSLLLAADTHLGCRADSKFLTFDRPMSSFSRLSFFFKLNDQGLRLLGSCDQSGTMLLDQTGTPMLQQADTEPRPMAKLVHALQPDSAVADAGLAVGATPQTAELLRRLPLTGNRTAAPSNSAPAGAPPVARRIRVHVPDGAEPTER